MKTLNQNTESVGNSVYTGDHGEWFIVAAQTRDSDCLERSNFRSIEKALQVGNVDETVYTERFGHWACGWVEYLLVNPAHAETVELAEKIRDGLSDYGVYDADDFSELEYEEANEVWKNCYNWAGRLEYIRKHRLQFEFRGFGDMLSCVRGRYFSGYASDLLN